MVESNKTEIFLLELASILDDLENIDNNKETNDTEKKQAFRVFLLRYNI